MRRSTRDKQGHFSGFNAPSTTSGGQAETALIVWGDIDTIRARLDEHGDAGANHVCVQPLDPATGTARPDMAVLEALAG